MLECKDHGTILQYDERGSLICIECAIEKEEAEDEKD